MDRTVVIGDIHGRDTWKDIVLKEEFSKLVFVGDYFDSRSDITPEKIMNNFLDIMEYKNKNKDSVITLIGNHDLHYLITEKYSGYNSVFSFQYNRLLLDNINNLQACYIQDNIIFSHAGLSKTWCKNNEIDMSNLEQSVNDLFKYKPYSFGFTGRNPYGDNITQGPMWIRPMSLLSDKLYNYTQIVGHTEDDTIKEKSGVWFIDNLEKGGYLVIEDKNFSINNLNNAKIKKQKRT